ncbi:MAG: His/Gly/Thr/Pro-type tRNA ligase C-terminal domain-containing protein, partial [Thermoguttaceae bacterium]
EVVVCPIKVYDEPTMKLANEIHDSLIAAGVDCILDDRDQRPGVKFKDADLVGFPLRIVLGEKGLAEGKVELKWRWEKESQMLSLEGLAEKVAELITEERKTQNRFRTFHNR